MIFRTLSPFLSIIVAVVLFVYFIKPTYNETLTLREDTVEYRDAVSKYKEFADDREKKLSDKSKHADKDEKLNSLLPEETDSTKLLIDLKSLATRNALLFGNVAVVEADESEEGLSDDENQEVTAPVLVGTDISFDIVGTYDQFKSFLEDLEDSQTLFEVVGISFDTSKKTLFQQYSITVRTYALPLAKTSL
jgi:Tfp pilus assembly protein PilO